MLKRVLLCAVLLSTASLALADIEAKDAAGIWQTTTGGYVQLYEEDHEWSGTIVGSKSGKPRYDEENPDESKRQRRLLGLTVLHGLRYEGDGKFEGGKIYDPNNGKTYKAKAEQKDMDTLEVRGFIGFSLFGRSQTWKRIDPGLKNVHQDLLHKPAPPGPQS